MKSTPQQKYGFTLLEILLVVALLTTLAGISLPISLVFLQKSTLEAATQSTVQSLRKAQVFARSSVHDMSWGVYAENGHVTLFGGNSYATRNTTYDEVLPLANSISVSGQQETIFIKSSGDPQNAGTLVFQTLHDTVSITIAAKGVVSY